MACMDFVGLMPGNNSAVYLSCQVKQSTLPSLSPLGGSFSLLSILLSSPSSSLGMLLAACIVLQGLLEFLADVSH